MFFKNQGKTVDKSKIFLPKSVKNENFQGKTLVKTAFSGYSLTA
jgi:hypothetical protein